MQDDLLDMTSTEAALGKPVGNDLTEKKITIPLILALDGGGPEFRADVERFYDERRYDTRADRGSDRAGSRPTAASRRRRRSIAEYIERAKASLAPLGNAPARAEFVAIADALLSSLGVGDS